MVRPSLAAVSLRVRRIYPFVEPTAAVERPGDDRVWVTERAGYPSYVDGANVAGFVKVADAMLAQGVV